MRHRQSALMPALIPALGRSAQVAPRFTAFYGRWRCTRGAPDGAPHASLPPRWHSAEGKPRSPTRWSSKAQR